MPVTTASGDAVSVEAPAEGAAPSSSRGRLLAQFEHNAMLALGLVRAGLLALQGVTGLLERATQLLSRHHGVLEPGAANSLRRVFDELAQHVQNASHDGHSLLTGVSVAFALDDPWQAASEPLHIALPDLSSSVLGEAGVQELQLGARTTVAPILQRLNAVRSALQQGQVSMQQAGEQLSVVLTRLDANRVKSAPGPEAADTFDRLAEQVRDHVLRAGASALRVQGAPSTRAAWLVEGFEENG
jgi:hypothetical protein